MTYRNTAMTAAIEALEEFDLSAADIAALAADLPAEYAAHMEAQAEAAWERRQELNAEYGPPGDETYRRQMRDAGRSHLLGDG